MQWPAEASLDVAIINNLVHNYQKSSIYDKSLRSGPNSMMPTQETSVIKPPVFTWLLTCLMAKMDPTPLLVALHFLMYTPTPRLQRVIPEDELPSNKDYTLKNFEGPFL